MNSTPPDSSARCSLRRASSETRSPFRASTRLTVEEIFQAASKLCLSKDLRVNGIDEHLRRYRDLGRLTLTEVRLKRI